MTMSFIALSTLFTVPAFSNLFKINPLFKIDPLSSLFLSTEKCWQMSSLLFPSENLFLYLYFLFSIKYFERKKTCPPFTKRDNWD